LLLRNIKKDLVSSLFNSPHLILFDKLNKTHIIISKSNKKIYALVYFENKSENKIITIHPINKNQIENRIKNQRWELIKIIKKI
jgi:hypothetical protein